MSYLQLAKATTEAPLPSTHEYVESADGCSAHRVTTRDVDRWWAIAAEKFASVWTCVCCGGPTPAERIACTRCSPLAGAAADAAPTVRLSVYETEDGSDIRLLRRIRAVI